MGAADCVAAAMAVNVLLKSQEAGGTQREEKKKDTGKHKEEEKKNRCSKDCFLRYLRVLKALVILLILTISAFILLLFLAPFTFFFLRLFSLHWSRKLTSSMFGRWLAMWPFLFEKINKTKVIVSGNKLPVRERIILICNHRTEVDWMYLWNLALRKKRIGNVKYVMKSSARNAPVFGWAFHVLEFLPIYRKWEMDALIFERILSSFKDRRDPLWLIIFPEGTDYT